MPNGDSPKIVITFDPNGNMNLQANVPPAMMALAAQFMLMQVQAALMPAAPGPQIVVPRLQFPQPKQGV